MPGNNYLKLARLAFLMNSQSSSSIPVTFTLLKVFDLVLLPEEVDFLLTMGSEPQTKLTINKKSKLAHEDFERIFKSVIEKGMVWSRVEDGVELFAVSPIMLGWFEVYLCNGSRTTEKREFAQWLTRLFNSWKKYNTPPIRQFRNWANKKNQPHHTIKPALSKKQLEINTAIAPQKSHVITTASINELIVKFADEKLIAVVHCFCRQWKSLEGISCRLSMPLESCIVLGKFSQHAVQYGFGRFINKDEALGIIEETNKKGGVHIVWYDKDDCNNEEIAVCNCCWDCCGVLGSYNRGINSLHFKTYYSVTLSGIEKCTGCGLCVKFCPVGAISMKDEKATIDYNRCIGCLQCYHKCKKGAIEMYYNERDAFLPLLKRSVVRL